MTPLFKNLTAKGSFKLYSSEIDFSMLNLANWYY